MQGSEHDRANKEQAGIYFQAEAIAAAVAVAVALSLSQAYGDFLGPKEPFFLGTVLKRPVKLGISIRCFLMMVYSSLTGI